MGHSHPHERHSHGGGGHSHSGGSQNRRALTIALAITATYTVAEVIGGLITGSLALLADAEHMLSDNFSLGLALFAFWLSAKPATPERSFGYKRAEILAALFNGVTLVAISIWIFYEAYRRFLDPPEILGGWMMAVAVMGLFVNVAAALVLSRSEGESLNLHGALRHIIADLLGSVGVIAAAVIILLTGWLYADPIISVLIGFLVLGSSWKLLKESTNILLEQAPRGIDANEVVGRKMVGVEGVEEVHDLHVWEITSCFPALAAHVLVGQGKDWHERRRELEKVLYREFGIEHTTLQVDHLSDHAAEGPRLKFLPRIAKRDTR
jgi:cobalt-zinc-cadmium efflux system protein